MAEKSRSQQVKQSNIPPTTLTRVILAIIGGLVGMALTIAVGAILLYILAMLLEAIFGPFQVRRIGPKAGLALIVVPIAGAIWGIAVGWNLHQHQIDARLKQYLAVDVGSMLDRAWIAWAAIWTTAMIILVLMLGAFWRGSRYWNFDRDALATMLWWLVPVLGGFALSRIVSWVMRGSR